MKRLLVLFLLVSQLGLAQAGSACNQQAPDAGKFMQAMALAEQTRIALDSAGAQVALLARVGQDLSAYGLRYSHLAFAWRDQAHGRWLVVHQLNECGTARSALFNEGLGNFFLDDMVAFEAALLVPGPESQARLLAVLGSSLPLRLHEPNYNMLAYGYATRYQNSNQWLLETYAASASAVPVLRREQAQAWLKLAAYEPITVHVAAVTRLGARLFKANIAFDDHPFARRMAGQIDTVTVESVLRFVARHDAQARVQTIRLND